MSCFKVEYFASDRKHIELCPDGTIVIYPGLAVDEQPIHLDYRQSDILKRMIIAQNDLEKRTM